MLGDVLSTMERLQAIPEPEGVTLYRVPPHWEAGGLTVDVGYCCGSEGIGARGERASGLAPVPLDKAHDLSWRGPEVYVWPQEESWQQRKDGPPVLIRRVWTVTALGFIEAEACEAYRAVRRAIDGKRLPQRGRLW